MQHTAPFTIFKPYTTQVHICVWPKTVPVLSNAKVPYILNQVHGNVIQLVSSVTQQGLAGDGAMATDVNVTLAVRFADCQNFLLYEPNLQLIGVIHAGWQGLVNGVIAAWFIMLQKKFGADGTNVLVGSGPSLCTNCAEFSEPALELPTIDAKYFVGNCVNLRQVAYDQFKACNVQACNYEALDICPKCNAKDWYSYRGDRIVKEDSTLRNYMTIELL